MDLEIDLPKFELAEGANANTEAVEDAIQKAVDEAAKLYAKEIEAQQAGARTVNATPEAQDGGATVFVIVATAFITGLAKELGKQAAVEIAERARKLLRHKSSKLLTEAKNTSEQG